MSKKYCANPECVCNNPSSESYRHLFDGDTFCPYCGERLVDLAAEGTSLVQGDANAISELNNTVGSYNTKNETHNVDSHNVTYVLNGKAVDDMSRGDRKSAYREFCRKLMVNGVISRRLRGELDMKASELELSDTDKREVESSVRTSVQSKEAKALSQVDRMTLSFAARQIAMDNDNVMENLPKLEALCDTDDDEVLFYYYLLSVCDNPSMYIRKFENRMSDTYWQSYWAYIAYLVNGNLPKAEKVLRSLSIWDEYPCDNQLLLRCSGFIYADKRGGTDGENIRMGVEAMSHCVSTSALLDTFKSAVGFIIATKGSVRSFSDSSAVNFYLKRIFGFSERNATSMIEPVAKQTWNEPESGKPVTMRRDVVQPSVKAAVDSGSLPAQQTTGGSTDNSTRHFLGMVSSALVLIGCLVYYLVSSGSDSTESAMIAQDPPVQTTPAETTVKTSGNTSARQPAGVSQKSDQASELSSQVVKKAELSSKSGNTASDTRQERPANTARSEPSQTPQSKSVEEMSQDEALAFGKSAFSKGDYPAAVKGFMKASESGSAVAKYELSQLFSQGLGVSKDLNYAFTLMKAAADAGYTKAYRGLADMYHGGRGVAKDRAAAEYWYGKAADNGDQEARRILNNM